MTRQKTELALPVAQTDLKNVPESIADVIQADNDEHEHPGRRKNFPPVAVNQEIGAIVQHGAPVGIGRLDPNTEEPQRRQEQLVPDSENPQHIKLAEAPQAA